MARRGPKRKMPVLPGDASDPHGMTASLAAFLEWSAVTGRAERTVRGLRFNAITFLLWCEQRGITRPMEVTRPILLRYQRHLYHYRTKAGRPLTFRSQNMALSAVRLFFRYLSKSNLLLYNPAADMDLPRSEKRLPRYVLTAGEAEAVLNATDLRLPMGVRDRAIMEVFYSTGIRRSELIRLQLYDLDVGRGTVMIRQGKGKKDRVIPIGDRALAWVDKYLRDVRPELVVEPSDGTLFLSASGEALSGNRLSQMVKDYLDASGIGKSGACHLFRHTMATLMLENGADIRFIQAMLGHAELSTTQIYTQVSIRKLKEIHTATHPAKMTRTSEIARMPAEGTGERSPGDDPATCATSVCPTPMSPEDDRAALFDTPAVEAAEDGE
jgi:integrase/recombinase XerD